MQLHHLKPNHPNKSRKPPVGRGGKRGTTSGHGTKGQKARSGRRIRPADRDLIQRLPKLRGLNNPLKSEKPKAINLNDLAAVKGPVVNSQTLVEAGLVRNRKKNVKILGSGEISRALTFEGIEISKSAKEKIEKAGGKIISKN